MSDIQELLGWYREELWATGQDDEAERVGTLTGDPANHFVMSVPEREQTERMQRMRHIVREHNVYRWAAHLLSDLTEIRIEMAERAEV